MRDLWTTYLLNISGCECTHITVGPRWGVNLTINYLFFLLAEPFWWWLQPNRVSLVSRSLEWDISPFYYYNFFFFFFIYPIVNSLNLFRSIWPDRYFYYTTAYRKDLWRSCEEFNKILPIWDRIKYIIYDKIRRKKHIKIMCIIIEVFRVMKCLCLSFSDYLYSNHKK